MTNSNQTKTVDILIELKNCEDSDTSEYCEADDIITKFIRKLGYNDIAKFVVTLGLNLNSAGFPFWS